MEAAKAKATDASVIQEAAGSTAKDIRERRPVGRAGAFVYARAVYPTARESERGWIELFAAEEGVEEGSECLRQTDVE